MPRVKVAWHDVWIGASVTSLLFTIGMEVNATAELVKVDGRTLTFRVEARDARELIGDGTHERVIVNVERFHLRVQKKLSGGNLTEVGAVNKVAVEPRVVPMAPEAKKKFNQLDCELIGRLRESRGTGFSSILARIEENATKLAMIRAVSHDPVAPLIEEADANWGILLAQHCAELTIREVNVHVSENQIESHHKRTLQIVRDSGAPGMTKSDFTRRTQFMDQRQRDGVLRTLVDAGLVEVTIVQNRGRPLHTIKVL